MEIADWIELSGHGVQSFETHLRKMRARSRAEAVARYDVEVVSSERGGYERLTLLLCILSCRC
jgi:hypothetical protein